MKTLIALLGCTALLAGCSSHSPNYPKAQWQNAPSPKADKFAVGLGAGTTGATVEAKYAPNDTFGLRTNFNFLDFSVDEEFDDIDYEGDFNATTFGGFVDVAPFQNGFVLSGGAYVGDKTLDLDATPTTNVEIGGQTFTPTEVGTLTGKAELSSFSPYAGIGYDGFIAGSRDWSFNARAGVMFTGSPEVDLVSANGTLSNNPVLLQELEAEVAAIEDDADGYKYYPVLTIGIARRF
ncbi:MAG: hypothetical protein ABJN22_08330 [Litorimonas sp.]